jgi:hypothetical protein
MEEFYALVSDELLNKLKQIKVFIKKHSSTIGLLTEEILRTFLKNYLPKRVTVEQGFVRSKTGRLSKQCDIIIYDSHNYAPFYRINDVVVVPVDSVIAIIEVKTTLNKSIFRDTLIYFHDIKEITTAKAYLFIYKAPSIQSLNKLFLSYEHPDLRHEFDHDTFQYLPDEITAINNSYHLKKAYVDSGRDMAGYDSFVFENQEGTEIGALQNFFLSIYEEIELYNKGQNPGNRNTYHSKTNIKNYFAFGLFDL